jgi:endonuclease G
MPPPLPQWSTHAASFCLGAALASMAAASAVLGTNHDRGGRRTTTTMSDADADADDRSRGTTTTVISPLTTITTTTTTTTTTDAKTNRYITHMTSMLPSSPLTMRVPNPNLAIAYDARTRNPLYVIERLRRPIARRDDGGGKTATDAATTTTATRTTGNAHRRDGMRFREDKSLSPYHRSRNGQYRRSGYDRGHMAPAGDFANSTMENREDENDENGRRSAMDDTFALTNVSPQVPRFNRTIWLRLEEFVREEAGMTTTTTGDDANNAADDDNDDNNDRRGDETTYVITGPLWLPKYHHRSISPSRIGIATTGGGGVHDDDDDANDENDGGGRRGGGGGGEGVFRYSYEGIGRPPSLVAVPTHFYKVIAVIVNDGGESNDHDDDEPTSDVAIPPMKASLRRFAAFVLPNSSNPLGDYDDIIDDGVPPRRRGIRLIDHVVRLTDLEAVAGMEFFPTLFGKYVNDGTDDVPVMKEIADALTDEIMHRRGTTIKNVDAGRGGIAGGGIYDGALVPLSDNGEGGTVVDAGRRRRMRRVLRDNSPIPFRHICRDNDRCFKLHRV